MSTSHQGRSQGWDELTGPQPVWDTSRNSYCSSSWPPCLSVSALQALSCVCLFGWPFFAIPVIPLVPGKWSVLLRRGIFRSSEAAVCLSVCTDSRAVCWQKNVSHETTQAVCGHVASVRHFSGLWRFKLRQVEVCSITAGMAEVVLNVSVLPTWLCGFLTEDLVLDRQNIKMFSIILQTLNLSFVK